jgi:hypothetical protein
MVIASATAILFHTFKAIKGISVALNVNYNKNPFIFKRQNTPNIRHRNGGDEYLNFRRWLTIGGFGDEFTG